MNELPTQTQELQQQAQVEQRELQALESISAPGSGHYNEFERESAFLIATLYQRTQEMESRLHVLEECVRRDDSSSPATPPSSDTDSPATAEKYLAEYGGRRCTAVCPPRTHIEEVAHWCVLAQGHEGSHVHLCVLDWVSRMNAQVLGRENKG